MRGAVTKMTSKCSLFRVSRNQIIHGFHRKSKYVTQFLKTYPEAFFFFFIIFITVHLSAVPRDG